MDDAAAEALRAKLDRALAGVPPNVGIAFGEGIFTEFRRRSWITLEKFGVLGTTLMEASLPAYGRTHYAHFTWDIPEFEFRIGRNI